MKNFLIGATGLVVVIGGTAFAIFGQGPSKSKKPAVEKTFVRPEGVMNAPSFSQAISVKGGRTVYISGQVAWDEKGELVGKGDFPTQYRKALDNLKKTVEASGGTIADIVKVNTYIVNYKPESLGMVRGIRREFFPMENQPASTLVGVQSLFQEGYLVEIEAVAVIPEK